MLSYPEFVKRTNENIFPIPALKQWVQFIASFLLINSVSGNSIGDSVLSPIYSKSQLILKCLLGVSNQPKKPKDICPIL